MPFAHEVARFSRSPEVVAFRLFGIEILADVVAGKGVPTEPAGEGDESSICRRPQQAQRNNRDDGVRAVELTGAAAFFNDSLGRNLDYNDTWVGARNPSQPGDVIRALASPSAHTGVSRRRPSIQDAGPAKRLGSPIYVSSLASTGGSYPRRSN